MSKSNEEVLKSKLKLNIVIICILVVLLIISILVLVVGIFSNGVVSENNLSNLGMVCERR